MNQRGRQENGETGVYSRNYWVLGRSITRESDISLSQLQAISTYMSFDVRKSIKQIELSMHGWNPWFWVKRVVKHQIQLELLVSTWGILHSHEPYGYTVLLGIHRLLSTLVPLTSFISIFIFSVLALVRHCAEFCTDHITNSRMGKILLLWPLYIDVETEA